MSAQIVFDGVNKTFRGTSDTKAIDDLSFEVPAGEFLGYAGPNGAGKSTSIKAMTGLLAIDSGTVRVRNLDPLRKRKQLARHIGVVFGQRSQLLWELSPLSFFEMIKSLYRVSEADYNARLHHLTNVLELKSFVDQPVRSLSLGQRMRCELTAALLPRPEILFLDEPTIGLDLEAKIAMRETLQDLNRNEGTTVVLTTHDLADIEALCSRLMVIDHGRLAYDGSIESLLSLYSREVTVEFQIPGEVELELDQTWQTDTGRNLVRVTFDRDRSSTAKVIGAVLAQTNVIDLSILEPNIEDVIGSIYRSARS